jgi:thiol-disulfide isomerase/thioredoxin
MSSGVYVVLGAVIVALVVGATLALRNGRFRGTHAVRGASAGTVQPPVSVLDGTSWEGQLGERATLLQFSSAFCAPCRATRRILGEVVQLVPGVAHIEVDAEHHLDVVRRLGILRTPTTIVLSAGGVEVTRASGAPTRQQVLTALEMAVEQP